MNIEPVETSVSCVDSQSPIGAGVRHSCPIGPATKGGSVREDSRVAYRYWDRDSGDHASRAAMRKGSGSSPASVTDNTSYQGEVPKRNADGAMHPAESLPVPGAEHQISDPDR